MKKIVLVSFCVMFILAGCGSSNTEEATTATTTAIATTAATTTATATTTVTTTTTTSATTAATTTTKPTATQPTTKAKKSSKDSFEKYLSNETPMDGGAYSVDVAASIKGDFTTLKGCALLAMKKAYATFGTMEIAVFGYFDGDVGDPAFSFNGANGNKDVVVYRDGVSPSGWTWQLDPADEAYIKGN